MSPPLVAWAWAGLLAVNTTLMIVLGGGTLPVLLLGGAAAGSALLGVLLALRRRGPAAREAIPDLSLPVGLAAVGVAALLLGAEVGTWLLAIGAGTLVLALAGLERERRATPPDVPRAGTGTGERTS